MRSSNYLHSFLFFSLSFCFSFTSLFGQNFQLVDSLIRVIPNHKDSAKVDLFVKIAHHLNNFDPQRTREYAKQAVDLAEEIDYRLGLAKGYQQLSLSYFMEENHKDGHFYIEKARVAYLAANSERYLSGIYAQIAHLLNNQGKYIESLSYYKKALRLSTEYEDHHITGASLFSMAYIHSILGNYSKAFDLMKQSKPLVTHKPYLINYYLSLGELYLTTGNPNESLEEFNKAVELCLELENEISLAHTYESIARAYSSIGEYEQAATYYFKIIDINKSLENTYLNILYHLGLGDLYRLWKNYDEAQYHYQQGEKIARENELHGQLAKIHSGMGMISRDQHNFDEATSQFQKALDIAKKIQSLKSIIDNYLHLCETFILKKQYDQAENLMHEALTYVSLEQHPLFYSSINCKLGYVYLKKGQYQKSVTSLQRGLAYYEKEQKNTIDLRDYTRYMSEAYAGLQNDKMALVYYKKYTVFNDNIVQALNDREVLKVRTNYETEEKEKQIELLHEKEQNQKAKLVRQRLYMLVLSLVLILGSLLTWMFFQRFKWKKAREKMALEKEHLEMRQQMEMTELRNRWFENISHEFRTPLTLILGPLGSALKNNQTTLPFQSMYNSAQKLLNLVNESLELTKLEKGQMTLIQKTEDVNHFVKGISKTFIPLAEIKKVHYSIEIEDDPVWLSIDKSKLEKAISNIIRNAFDNISNDCSIEIKSYLDDQARYVVEIADTGKGIHPKHHKSIFDRFYQVDKSSFNGSGIGLSLAKEIVDLHEGKIELVSSEGAGTTFRILLPYDASIQEEVAQKSTKLESQTAFLSNSTPSHELPTIFVVEDNQEVLNYILEISSTHANVIGFSNAKDAIEALNHNDPDLIICDVMMPGIDGYEFTEMLKTDVQFCHIPIVLLTAKSSHDSKIKGLKAGADDYIAKPFNVEELLTRSHNIINRHKQLKQLFSAQNSPIPVTKMTRNKLDQDFLNKAIKVVNQNLEDTEFNVSKFTRNIGMSRTTLYNKLKALTDKNIAEFIRALRIQKAIELIKMNAGNMNEIAFATGFNNRQSFIYAFKVELHQTPSEFKKSMYNTSLD